MKNTVASLSKSTRISFVSFFSRALRLKEWRKKWWFDSHISLDIKIRYNNGNGLCLNKQEFASVVNAFFFPFVGALLFDYYFFLRREEEKSKDRSTRLRCGRDNWKVSNYHHLVRVHQLMEIIRFSPQFNSSLSVYLSQICKTNPMRWAHKFKQRTHTCDSNHNHNNE